MSTSLPLRIEKQIAGKCCYSGCDDPARDGSDYCDPHDAHERGRDAAKKRRRRQRLADAGVCIGGCGRKVGKRKRPNGTIALRECRHCAKATKTRRKRTVPVDAGTVPGDAPDPSPRGFFKHETGKHDWGSGTYQTSRYVGHTRRGRLTREEQIDERIRDLRHAAKEIEKAIERHERLKDPVVLELPPIQRDAAYRVADDPIGVAARTLDGLLDRDA